MEIDATTLNQFFQALTILILAVIAWYNGIRTKQATATATAALRTADSNEAMAAVQTAPPANTDTRLRDAHGNLITNQTGGSQYWMDAGYKGPEPDLATKKAYSDAAFAYDAAVQTAKALKEKYGEDNLSPKLAALAK